MAFFPQSNSQPKTSLGAYEHNDSITMVTRVKETIINNCSWDNAKALGWFALAAAGIYFFAGEFGPKKMAEGRLALIFPPSS